MNRRLLVAIGLLALGVVVAVDLAGHYGPDAGAVLLGVAVGTAACAPTSLLLVALLRRERRDRAAELAALQRQWVHPAQSTLLLGYEPQRAPRLLTATTDPAEWPAAVYFADDRQTSD